MTRPILLRGGRVIDPSRGLDETSDVLLQQGKVAAVGRNLGTPDGAEVVDAAGKVLPRVPVASTRSSHARSRSVRMCRAASHASGLNQ